MTTILTRAAALLVALALAWSPAHAQLDNPAPTDAPASSDSTEAPAPSLG